MIVDSKALVNDKYRLVQRIAAGGMGEVWAATNELTSRRCAIKFLLPELAENLEALSRFIGEAKTTGRLQHPAIIDVYDAGAMPDGTPFLVMELLSGQSLESRLMATGVLPPGLTCTYLAHVAEGLDVAHRAGVVHRDLSSANVFLARPKGGGPPQPKILDFGVSKNIGPIFDGTVRTGNGAVLGSPAYMSPEQASGAEKVDARTDIWAVGVLLYECVTGRPPFTSQNYNALMLSILSRPHRPVTELVPTLDSELADLIESCLVKDPAYRIQSAAELAERLRLLAARLSLTERSTAPQRRASDRVTAPPLGRMSDPRFLVTGAVPRGARAWHFIKEKMHTKRGVGAATAACSTALGVFIGVFVAAGDPAPAPAAVLPSAPAQDPVPTRRARAELPAERCVDDKPAAKPEIEAESLVEAMRTGLESRPAARQPKPPRSKLAHLPQ